ncbi:hypothetical protein [Rhizobium rhizogenes]|uniref:hypothetical protein n=1 Tax=Rhizobium rhizogenes TaxID=359 RepID=UPI00068E5E97|nr:hypothetical protein [Rhizobium rhizogenes]
MDIGDNGEASQPASRPKPRKRVAMEDADTAVIRRRIEIVVVDDFSYLSGIAVNGAEKKRPGFMLALTPAIKFG